MRDSNRELFSLAYALKYNADRILYEIEDEPNWIAAESYMRKFFFLVVLAKDASKNIDDYGSDNVVYGSDNAVIDTVHGLMQRYQHKADSIRRKNGENVTDDEKNEVANLLTAIVGLCEVLATRKRN